MKKLLTSLTLGLGLIGLVCPTAIAQEADAEAQQFDAHADLLISVNAGIDNELVIANLAHDVATMFVDIDPVMTQMEAEHPGLIAAIAVSFIPILTEFDAHASAKYDPQLIAILRELFTAEEAQGIAAFYRSDLGLRLLTSVSQNAQASAALEQAFQDQNVTQNALERDDQETLQRTMQALTAEELREIERIAGALPGIERLGVFTQRSLPIRQAAENEPLTPQEERQIEAAITRAFSEYEASLPQQTNAK